MSALDRIAELHVRHGDFHYCAGCGHPWPCPTRRLCDEARAEFVHAVDDEIDRADAAEADAERLAAAIDAVLAQPAPYYDLTPLVAARSAHDALTENDELNKPVVDITTDLV